MTINVNDILHIEIMKNAVLIAGNNGLHKKVQRVASIEKPFVDHPEYCFNVAKPGDIYVSKLYVFADDIERFLKEIEFQHKTKGSGFITYKEMVSFISDEAIALANRYHIPIIAVDEDIGLTEISFAITDLIIKDQKIQLHVFHIEHLLFNDLKQEEIEQYVNSIDWNLRNYIQGIYLKTDHNISPMFFQSDETDMLVPILGGVLYLITDDSLEIMRKKKQMFIDKAKEHFQTYTLGISQMRQDKTSIKKIIIESVIAFVYGNHAGKRITNYKELGEFALIAELRQNEVLKEYILKFKNKISDFDREHKLELDQILEQYVRTEGDFKAIAETRFVHETTIRYRLNKLKESLNYASANDFYAEMKTAVYADWVLNDKVLSSIR